MKCCGNLDYLRKTIFIPLYLYRTACLPLQDRSPPYANRELLPKPHYIVIMLKFWTLRMVFLCYQNVRITVETWS